MKIYLATKEPLEGYHSLFPGQGTPPKGFTNCSVNEFPGVSENEAEAVVVSEVLEKLDPEDVEKAVAYWVSRLAHGAILCITFRDLEETCQQIANRRHSVAELNEVVFANRSAHTADSLPGMLRALGLTVRSVIMDGAFCTVAAVRP